MYDYVTNMLKLSQSSSLQHTTVTNITVAGLQRLWMIKCERRNILVTRLRCK